MDYSQFLYMKEELSLIAVILILFVVDLFTCPDHKGTAPKLPTRSLTLPAVILLTIHTVINLFPGAPAEAFGGMYQYAPMQTIIKAVLNVGTLIVILMAHEWLKREDTSIKQGEFYVLTLSTLLGMYFMISAGHFLMFFIGLEMASIPMAALVAFDKYRHHSAEAGAKYILTALFSSALLLFGLSMIYGTSGTLYFDDLPEHITGNMLQVMAFVFFFAGMGFKISLVPFHLWTADVYEGAPTAVTSYLSVISKGSAAFVLMTILTKVFAPMTAQWQEVLFWVTIASINKVEINDYNGLYRTNPKLAFIMTLALFSLAGIPPFAGFFSKFFIFMAAFNSGFHLLVFIALINTVVSLYYYLLIVKAMYINPNEEPIPAFRSDGYTKLSLALCTLGIIALGIASCIYQGIDKFA